MLLNNFAKFNLKKKIIISLLTLFLVIGTIIYFIMMPAIEDIKQMETEIENQKIDLEKKYLKGQSLKQLTENLKKIEPQLSALNQVFIVQNRELEFITTLEELANKNNITQKIDLEISKNYTDNKTFQKIPLKLSAKGDFINLMNYLINLETLNYYININSLELSSGLNQLILIPGKQTTYNNSNNINMIISADTYWKYNK